MTNSSSTKFHQETWSKSYDFWIYNYNASVIVVLRPFV
jgi:hypothetical protein